MEETANGYCVNVFVSTNLVNFMSRVGEMMG